MNAKLLFQQERHVISKVFNTKKLEKMKQKVLARGDEKSACCQDFHLN